VRPSEPDAGTARASRDAARKGHVRRRAGREPILIVAPHGGRREPRLHAWAAGSIRVNDLHTADLAWELAERLDADALVNTAIDRNDLDLNRLAQIRTHAPWFLDMLADVLERIALPGGPPATVLVIHGWNVGNPACDLGVGKRLPDQGPPGRSFDGCAVDSRFHHARLAPFREWCERAGIAVGLGWRYPASSRNNLIQLFTGRYAADDDPRMRRLGELGRNVNAVQLELSIPLRWPSPWRGALLDACVRAFGDHPPPSPPAAGAEVAAPSRPAPPRKPGAGSHVTAQFQDAAGGVAGLLTVDVGPATAAGRLLLMSLERPGLYLYTGECPAATSDGSLRVGCLVARPQGTGDLLVRFEGPLLWFPDTDPFLDLEVGLSGARACDARLSLSLTAADGASPTEARFATVSGELHVGHVHGRPHPSGTRAGIAPETSPDAWGGRLAGAGFVAAGRLRTESRPLASIPRAPGGPLRIVMPRSGPPLALWYRDGRWEGTPVDTVTVEPRPEDGVPHLRATLHDRASPVEITARARRTIPIVRQLPRGGTARYTLAFCEFRVGGAAAGMGWAELAG
jgi:hypothetical protein